ncbi:hypothetical protein [Rhodoblastus sp.]|uniref:hypothetical protein n=1 Tax=Rhodoblastus sp. TaxID=1962975 RepID=UPI0035AFE18B
MFEGAKHKTLSVDCLAISCIGGGKGAPVHGSCFDDRAAASIDLQHDAKDADVKIADPTLALFGAKGITANPFAIAAETASPLRSFIERLE